MVQAKPSADDLKWLKRRFLKMGCPGLAMAVSRIEARKGANRRSMGERMVLEIWERHRKAGTLRNDEQAA